jgi:hypothetical protein
MWGFVELVKYIFKNSSSFNIILTQTTPDIYLLPTWLWFILMFYDPSDHKQEARQKIFKYLQKINLSYAGRQV